MRPARCKACLHEPGCVAAEPRRLQKLCKGWGASLTADAAVKLLPVGECPCEASSKVCVGGWGVGMGVGVGVHAVCLAMETAGAAGGCMLMQCTGHSGQRH